MIQGEASYLPFRPEQFDLVTVNMVLHYMSREAMIEFLDETYSVLKPGGLFFVIGIYHAQSPRMAENVGRWVKQTAPWGQEIEAYNHDVDVFISDDTRYSGFDLLSGGLLEISQNDYSNPGAKPYLNRKLRFAAKFRKVTPAQKQFRTDNKDFVLPCFVEDSGSE